MQAQKWSLILTGRSYFVNEKKINLRSFILVAFVTVEVGKWLIKPLYESMTMVIMIMLTRLYDSMARSLAMTLII